ncbi:hypothetical protein E7745_14380 [Duncaniella sp. C9]|nr:MULTISPECIES: hypothetical protein [unclassified Duncaniella]QCD40614.1 hypothetical protein E7745_14380 [Duncaniella sp. C9]QCP71719.1 hypothetical protein FDZ78_03620 [Duncaniella sp. B8]
MPERFDFGRIFEVGNLVGCQSGVFFLKGWGVKFQSVAVQIAEDGKIWLLENEMLKSGVRCEANNPLVFEVQFVLVLKISELVEIMSLRVGVVFKAGWWWGQMGGREGSI